MVKLELQAIMVSLPMKGEKELSQEMYEQNWRKGEKDTKRYEIVRGERRRRTVGTVSVMVDRQEKGKENGKEVRECQGD